MINNGPPIELMAEKGDGMVGRGTEEDEERGSGRSEEREETARGKGGVAQ